MQHKLEGTIDKIEVNWSALGDAFQVSLRLHPIQEALEVFREAGIQASQGLAMRLAYPSLKWSWRQTIGELKEGHVMKCRTRSGHRVKDIGYAKVDRRKYGRWIRRGRIPKHL
jgi:hypothetical protein